MAARMANINISDELHRRAARALRVTMLPNYQKPETRDRFRVAPSKDIQRSEVGSKRIALDNIARMKRMLGGAK